MSSPLFLQLYRTLRRGFNRVSDGLILELDAANTSSYTGANGSVTDGSTFTNLGSGVNSNFTFENNSGNLVAYIESTPKYISAKPYDAGYPSTSAQFNYQPVGEFIVQSTRSDAAEISMSDTPGTGFRNASRTVEWWGRITARPGDSSYVANTNAYQNGGVGSSTLFGGSRGTSGVLRLFDNGDDTCALGWSWDDSSTGPSNPVRLSTANVSLNTWSQIVVVLEPADLGAADEDEHKCTYYINGEAAGTIINDEVFGTIENQWWYIGRDGRGVLANDATNTTQVYYPGYTHCDTSIFRQYNRALTANEIRQNYNAERSKFRIVNYNPVISNPPVTSAASPLEGERGYGLDWDLTQASPTIHFYKVTNLNTSGTGSFIDAVTGTWSGLRIVVFEVSGVLDLSNYSAGPADTDFQAVKSTNGNLIIAGQTAPSGGFWLKGGRLVLRGEKVLVSHIGIFKTLLSTPTQVESIGDCLNIGNNINGANKIAIVNCAFYYSQDESLDVYEYATNVTFLNNIMSYSIDRAGHHPDGQPHNFGPLIGGITSTVDRIDFGRNFLSHHYFRNPSVGAENSLVYNNLIYNWGYGGIQFFAKDIPGRINIENNLSVKGPYTSAGAKPIYTGSNLTGVGTTVYAAGNRLLNSTLSDSVQADLIQNDAGSNWSLENTRQGDFPTGVVVEEIGTTEAQKKAFASSLLATVGPRPADRIALIQKPLTECLNSIDQTGGDYGTAPTNHPDDVGYPDFVGQTRTLDLPANPNGAGTYINQAFDFINSYHRSVMGTVVTGSYDSYNPPFPRLGGRMRLTTNLTESEFNEDVAKIAKMHVWLESTWRDHSFVNGTYNQSNIVSHIRSLDTPYPGNNSIMGVYTNPVQAGTDVNQFTNKLFAESGVGGNRDWFLRYAGTVVGQAGDDPTTYTTSARNVIEAGKSVGGSSDSNVSNKFRPNPNLATTPDSSTVAPFTSGMRWHQWYARWWAHPSSEHTANLGDWTSTGHGIMEPGSGWDFVYTDEVNLGDSFSNPTNADWDDDGVNEARTDADIVTIIKNYHVAYRSAWLTLFEYYERPNTLFLANFASLSQPAQPWYSNSDFVDVYNGGLLERISGYEHGDTSSPYGAAVTGQGFGFGDWSTSVTSGDTGTGFMGRYWRAMRYAKNPKLVCFEHDATQVKAQWDGAGGIHAGKSLYHWSRYYLCACLLDDGYYQVLNGGSDAASGTPEAEFGRIPWLDEYYGGDLNAKGWMGYPVNNTPPRTAYSNGVWVREFDNALVVINPYNNGTQTITLPSPGTGYKWQRLSGSQDSTTNNGADQPLSLTIAEHDGFILRRVAELSYTATWETGQKQTNGSTTDGGFVQAMEDSTYVDKTDYTSVGAAGFGPSTDYDMRIVASKLWNGTTVTPRNGNYFLSQTIYYDKHYSDFTAVSGDARTEFDSLDKPRTVMLYSTNQAAYKMPLNEEVWYGFSIYLPADLEHDTWNGSTPLNGSDNNTNILASSRLQADASRTLWSIQYRVCSDINASISRWTISRYISTGTVEANKSETDLGSVSGDLGKWTDFIIRYKNNPYTTQTTVGSRTYQPNSGILEVWKSYGDYIGATKDRYMTKVLSILNAPVGLGETTGTDGMDFRKEQYKYNWKRWAPSGTQVVSPSTVTGPIFIGHDELRVGTAANGIGFAHVHPTGKTEVTIVP